MLSSREGKLAATTPVEEVKVVILHEVRAQNPLVRTVGEQVHRAETRCVNLFKVVQGTNAEPLSVDGVGLPIRVEPDV